MPLYVLSFHGAVRRMNHYANADWQIWMIVAAIGALIILAGIVCQVIQLVVSVRDRELNRDLTGDPWDGRTLEWATTSPPPFYNFAHLPHIDSRDAFWEAKQRGASALPEGRDFQPIHMPRNTGAGVIISLFALALGFALVWHIWWLAILSTLGGFVAFMARAFDDDIDYHVDAEEVARIEAAGPPRAASPSHPIHQQPQEAF